MNSSPHFFTGRSGESLAATYLIENGYTVSAKNVRIGHDEIDIVAYDPEDKVMVFCEVKTRRHLSDDFHPELNITRLKRYCMARAARHWVESNGWEGGYRLDIVCIAAGKVVLHCRDIACEEE